MGQTQYYKKGPRPTKRNPREKLKTAPPFAHSVPPLPAITGDQPNDPPENTVTHWLPNLFAANASNREFSIVERVNR